MARCARSASSRRSSSENRNRKTGKDGKKFLPDLSALPVSVESHRRQSSGRKKAQKVSVLPTKDFRAPIGAARVSIALRSLAPLCGHSSARMSRREDAASFSAQRRLTSSAASPKSAVPRLPRCGETPQPLGRRLESRRYFFLFIAALNKSPLSDCGGRGALGAQLKRLPPQPPGERGPLLSRLLV